MIDNVFDDKLLKLTEQTKQLMNEKMAIAEKLVDDLPGGAQKTSLKNLLKSSRKGEASTESMLKDLKNIVNAG